MEGFNITTLSDTDEFKALRRSAWDHVNGKGDFSIDDLEPAQYKYFDKLMQLYGRFKDGNINSEQAKIEEEKIYSELQNYVDERLEYIADRKIIAENIKTAYDEISKAEKSHDVYELVELLAKAVGKFTDDESFAGRQTEKIKRN